MAKFEERLTIPQESHSEHPEGELEKQNEGNEQVTDKERLKELNQRIEEVSNKMKTRRDEMINDTQEFLDQIASKSELSEAELASVNETVNQKGFLNKVQDVFAKYTGELKKHSRDALVIASAVAAFGISMGSVNEARADLILDNQASKYELNQENVMPGYTQPWKGFNAKQQQERVAPNVTESPKLDAAEAGSLVSPESNAEAPTPNVTEVPKSDTAEAGSLVSPESNAEAPKSEVELFTDISKKLKNMNANEEINMSPEQLGKRMKIKDSIESLKDDIRERIGSKEYLQRLMKEFKCSEDEAKSHQKDRIDNLDNMNYFIMGSNATRRISDAFDAAKVTKSLKNITEMLEKGNLNESIDSKGYQIGGFIEKHPGTNEQIVILSEKLFNDEGELEESVAHEIDHSITRQSEGMSDTAKELLKGKAGYKWGGAVDLTAYQNKSDERFARFMETNKFLEDSGIKKYGEEFTSQHLEKLMSLYKKGEIKGHVKQFIENTNTADFIKIFNTIAESETQPKNEKEAVA